MYVNRYVSSSNCFYFFSPCRLWQNALKIPSKVQFLASFFGHHTKTFLGNKYTGSTQARGTAVHYFKTSTDPTDNASKTSGQRVLPGSTGDCFPEVLSPPTETFPHTVQIDNPHHHSLSEITDSCRRYLTNNLLYYGAVLFRNLPLKTAADFRTLSQGFGYKPMTYVGGAVERKELDGNPGTYTASDEPPLAVIEPHSEMAYSPVYPTKVMKVASIPPPWV